jgi:Uma2 family endonuclease
MAVHVETSQVASILARINSLRDDERLILHDITWEAYQELLDELGEHRHVLVSYSEGALEIMPLSHRHERHKEFILRLIGALTEELEIEMISAGSTTLQLESAERGAEPDTSFFIQHAARMIGRETYDLLTDPPPDIVVEVDISRPSYSKKESYARFGVPEFWTYNGKKFKMFRLKGASYVETARSVAFPFLQASDVAAFIERSKREGHNAVIKSFREWVRAHKPTMK